MLRVVFCCRPVICYCSAPCADTIFLGIADVFSSPRRARGAVNMVGAVKTLRRSNSLIHYFFYRRSIFSTEGSFG